MNTWVQCVTEQFNPISAYIRFLTRSWASHVEFATESGWTFGARYIGGVKWRGPESQRSYTYIERFTNENVDRALEWAVTQVHKPYDLTAIFGILADRNWRSEDSWFCSELVAAAFEQAKAPLFQIDTRLNRIFPGHIPMSLALTRFATLNI